jgi:uncharacterized caspase-like protein
MKKSALALLALVLSCLAIQPAAESQTPDADRPVKDKWALIIGISQFQNGKINLQYAAKDAKDFYEFLLREGHFAPDHIRLFVNENATRENIMSAIGDNWLPRVVQPDDLALIYISSHGSPSTMDREGINYLVAYNTEVDQLYATGIPIQELARTIRERVHSDRVVVVLDACHSGSARTADKGLSRVTNFDANEVAMGTGQLVVCSSAPNQVSWESKKYTNGVFTHHLMQALKDKPRFNDAFSELQQGVQTEVLQDRGELQTPELKSKWTGSSLRLLAVPAAPRAGLPEMPRLTPPSPTTIAVAVAPPPAAPKVKAAAVPAVAFNRPASASTTTSTAVAQPSPQAVAALSVAAPYGQSATNNNVRMKVLDVDQRITGYYVTLEAENLSQATLDPGGLRLECSSGGYFLQTLSGSGISGQAINHGQKTKIEFATIEKPDEVMVKFSKPGWQPIKLRLVVDDVSAPLVSQAVPNEQTTAVGDTANYGDFAGNGFVRMKVLDIDPKMTGFFMTVELDNDTNQPIEPWNIVFSYSKDGYAQGSSSGSSVWGATENIPAGRKTKLQFSAVSEVDTIQVKFPKPNWRPLTLRLR